MMIRYIQKIYIVVSIIVIVALSFALLKTQIETPSSYAVQQPEQEFIKIIPDTVQIDRSDLKYCCGFVSENKKMGCWLIKKYSCDYCRAYCEVEDE